ncbi:hypothetical protein TIFTF001_026014 [Ficus carica]|uniref:Cytochrome P450 n=1 Tax=Ficus carica TaxID=3494 RepID=A0AA88AQR1_FICCA|nr:hypothetical protein TIFTF001_026014 [Ficus carica]
MVALGRDFSGGGKYDEYGFEKLLEDYQELLGALGVGESFPSMELVHILTGIKSRLVRTSESFDRLLDQIVADHQNNPKTEKDDKQYYTDLVDVLLDVHKNKSAEMPLTMDNVKAIILDMFAAGTDTTFITIDWGMTELIMNPKSLKIAQAEVPIDFKGTDFEFIPFGAGRRICPGIAFAMSTIELSSSQLLHSFDWELPAGVTAIDLDMA